MNKDNIIIKRIQNFLYSFYAKDIKDARKSEIYHGLCHALMEDIGKKWVDVKNIKTDKNVYVLSFEYLPGKFLENNIRNLKVENEVKDALDNLGYSYEEILDYEAEASLGNGEIGVGSSYILNELTKKKIKTVGYSIRYEGGNMKQVIKNGMQVESSNYWLANGSKWEHKKGFNQEFEIDGRKLKALAYDIPIICEDGDYVNTLRLWSSSPISKIDFQDFSRGDMIKAYDDYIKDSSITQFLYLDNSTYEGKLLRLKQEYFYCYACIHDIIRRYFKHFKNIEEIKDKIKIIVSDIHPALSLIEFIKVLHDEYDFSYQKAISYSREIFDHFVFLTTNDSYESYDLSFVGKVNKEFLDTVIKIDKCLKKENPEYTIIKDNRLSFNNINRYLSNKFFVSSFSTYDYFKKKTDYKIENINLGIDRELYASSSNKNLSKFLKQYDIEDFSIGNIKKIKNFYDEKNFIDGLEEIKLKNKKDFIKKFCGNDSRINPYSIFDIQATNFHEVNRQILNALSIANLYYKVKNNSSIDISPTTYIFSGKANEGYYIAKENIKFILALKNMINKDRLIKDKIKIVFLEDLNVSKARQLYPTVDIYTNLTLPIYDNNGFEVLNACMNFSNILTSKGGISKNNKTSNHSFYYIGKDIDEFVKQRDANTYKAGDYYYSNDSVRTTVNNLINEPYENLAYNFKTIYDYLMRYNDSFHIFKDMEELSSKRINVSKDYLDKKLWVKNEIDNILWANEFYLDDDIGKLL